MANRIKGITVEIVGEDVYRRQIYGNAYAQIIRNGRGDVLGLYPLMPDKMKVDRDEKNRLIYIYSRYDEANPNLKEQGDIILYADEVLHIPGLGFDGLRCV